MIASQSATAGGLSPVVASYGEQIVSPTESGDYSAAKPLGQSNTQPQGIINNEAAMFMANRKGRSANKSHKRMASRAKSK